MIQNLWHTSAHVQPNEYTSPSRVGGLLSSSILSGERYRRVPPNVVVVKPVDAEQRLEGVDLLSINSELVSQ